MLSSLAMARDSLERAILGSLRAAIHDHGPITLENMTSAVKRILGNLPNAPPTELARIMGKRRWATMSKEQRAAAQSNAATALWKAMSPEDRSAEMSRRRRLGLRKKA